MWLLKAKLLCWVCPPSFCTTHSKQEWHSQMIMPICHLLNPSTALNICPYCAIQHNIPEYQCSNRSLIDISDNDALVSYCRTRRDDVRHVVRVYTHYARTIIVNDVLRAISWPHNLHRGMTIQQHRSFATIPQ